MVPSYGTLRVAKFLTWQLKIPIASVIKKRHKFQGPDIYVCTHTLLRVRMEVESKHVWMYFKTTTVCPSARNYLHFSNIQNTLTISWGPVKVLSIMASSSGLRSWISPFKSGLNVDEVCDTILWVYSSLKTVLLSPMLYEVMRKLISHLPFNIQNTIVRREAQKTFLPFRKGGSKG